MKKETFSFVLKDTEKPETVIRNVVKQIDEATEGYVCAKLENYDGEIKSYTKQIEVGPTGLETLLPLPLKRKTETIKVNIQNELGELNKERNRFEVYLTVKGLEHYKYRMMFVDYGSIAYPVTIVLNEQLAIGYNGKMDYVFQVDTMEELKQMIDVVINCDYMLSLLQSLINESMRKEKTVAIG